MKQTLSITRKELDGYFSSPMALIFVGVFLAVTLFSFFWVDAFWARGTADVRPLFRSIPLLTIFLVAALTMRQWSEEEQTGTLEILLTMPMRLIQLVIGKFLSVLVLVALALLLTIFLPITVSTLGDLDLGPVIGGYLAAILLASSYIAIGLFISSRTDNQIVALIITVLTCGAFHIIGTPTITELFNSSTAEILRNLSTSGRFQSIERGVIDLRDLLYYASLTVAFLALNVISLDSKRWSRGERMASYRFNTIVTVSLIIFNLVALNLIVSPVNAARADLTADQLYSLAPVTEDLLTDLNEPLLIRGYFSEENHPLLEPLVPQVQDLLDEYQIAANDELTIEILDPISDPELEAEANQTYGIRPTPLQTIDRSGNTLLNVYFDILVRYGDQSEVLNFGDLIEVEQFGGGDVEIRLRNLEYDLTSSIKRVVTGFQSIDSVLESLESPAQMTLYYTPSTLPEVLGEVPTTIQTVASEIQAQSNGQFIFETVDVNDPNDDITPETLINQYQIQPIAAGFFSPDTYYLHMVVESGDEIQIIFPSGELSEAELRTAIESALKRSSTGFLQVVGVWTPPDLSQQAAQFGQQVPPSLSQYTQVQSILQENYEVRPVDLSTGQVPADIDVLMVIAPQLMTEFDRYAIDQYLMRGGSVMIAATNYKIALSQFDGSLALEPVTDGVNPLLEHYGITLGQELVYDLQNEPFPVQVQRNVNGFTVNEVQALDYPPFVDVRPDGMNRDNPILSNLPAVTLNWVSPITISEDLSESVTVTPLLESSPQSWTTTDTNIQPNQDLYPQTGFPIGNVQERHMLAVALEGSFESFYVDNPSPFAEAEQATPEAGAEGEAPQENPLAAIGTLQSSPSTARIVVIGSAEFLNDNVFGLSSSLSGDRYLNSLQFVQNTVDWYVEDTELATIRSRGSSVRLLEPLTEAEQSRWEIINYVVALLALIALGVVWRLRKRAEMPMELISPDAISTTSPSNITGQAASEGGVS